MHKYKEFEEVKIGDIGEDYFNEPVIIADKGTLEEMMKKYPWQPGDMDDWKESGCDENTQVVAVRQDPEATLEGYENILYSYGGDGVMVRK